MGRVDICKIEWSFCEVFWDVKFTKYCTCARGKPGELLELSQLWTGFSIVLELQPYVLEAYLGNERESTNQSFIKTYCGIIGKPITTLVLKPPVQHRVQQLVC